MNEILKRVQEEYDAITALVSSQKLTVGDVDRLVHKHYLNVMRKVEQLEISRDNWRKKFEQSQKATKASVKSEEKIK